MAILEIKNLQKRFGDKEVLKGVDLSVPEHSVFGFIGKNGAGKTTTMKMILGLLELDAGEIRVAGEPVVYGQNTTNQYIGYLPDVPEFYSFMTAREYLAFCGEITGMSKKEIKVRSEELLELVGLSGERHRIKGFSRGMKQRLGIAQALLNQPKLLICDEPTSALDPVGRKEILDILLAARKQTTVVFSTHILSDVERICTDVAFLHDGAIHLQGKLADIKSRYRRDEYVLEFEQESEVEVLRDALREVGRELNCVIQQDEELKQVGGSNPIPFETKEVAWHEESKLAGRNTQVAFGTNDIERPEVVKQAGANNQFTFQTKDITLHEVLKIVAEKKLSLIKAERLEPSLESLFLEVVER